MPIVGLYSVVANGLYTRHPLEFSLRAVAAPEPALSLSKGLALFETWDFTVVSILGFGLTRRQAAGIFHHNQPAMDITDIQFARCDNVPKAIFSPIQGAKSLFRNILRISPLNPKIWRDFLRNPMIPKDRSKSFFVRVPCSN